MSAALIRAAVGAVPGLRAAWKPGAEYVVEAGRGAGGGGHLQQGASSPGNGQMAVDSPAVGQGPCKKPDSRPGPGTLGLLSPLSYR